MEDYETGPDAGGGVPIMAESLDLEIYQLACVFAASRELARWTKASEAISRLRNIFERAEAARRLIALAAMLRNTMDSWSKHRRDRVDKGAGAVGIIKPNSNKPKEREPLYFREACNKIIHAEHINFDVSRRGAEEHPTLFPIVHLYGKRGDLAWKAELKIDQFVRVAGGI